MDTFLLLFVGWVLGGFRGSQIHQVDSPQEPMSFLSDVGIGHKPQQSINALYQSYL